MANDYILGIAALCILLSILKKIQTWQKDHVFSQSHGCKPPPTDRLVTWLDPLGIGALRELEHRHRNHELLEFMRTRFEDNGYTFKSRVLLNEFFWTSEPKNIQAMLATQFHDFGVGIDRYYTFKPFMGHGIFTSDGAKWEQARALVRPNFVRDQVADLESFEVHFQNMLLLIPKDGKTPVELKELFRRMTLDSSSEMMFGESLNTLTNTDSEVATARFAAAFKKVQGELARRFRLGRLANWDMPREFLDACDVTRNFVDEYVRKAMLNRERDPWAKTLNSGHEPVIAEEIKGERYVFLDGLTKAVDDPVAVRDHLLNVLIPARDSTSTLLANAFHAVINNRRVLRRLQDEVACLDGVKPSFESLRNMKYLRWVMNETLRLWPVVPLNGRQANKDVTLPVGGGPDGKSPIHVKKGQNVAFSVYAMHRRKDLWGADANEFRPERWETLRPGWEYLPFSGGPRICIGQQLALNEAGYTFVRMLQCFRDVQSLETSPWREDIALTCSLEQALRVCVVPW